MRILAPAFFCALGLGGLVFACSSSDDNATTTKCDGGACSDAAAVVDTGAPEEIVDAGPSEFQGGGGDGGTTGGGFDAGTEVTGSDAGVLCLTGSQTEMEDNSVIQSANNVNGQSGTFCGRLDNYADIDFWRFNLPMQAQSLFIHIVASAGGLGIYASADDTEFPFPSQAPGDFVFAPGKNYVLRFTSRTGKPIDYRVELTIH